MDLIRAVRLELLGPAHGQNECIEENPKNRYILGIIKPYSAKAEENIDNVEEPPDVSDDGEEDKIKRGDKKELNSFGISFKMPDGVFDVLVSYAEYIESNEGHTKCYKRIPAYHKFTVKNSSEFILRETNFNIVTLKVEKREDYYNVLVYNTAKQKIPYDNSFKYYMFQPSIRIVVKHGEIEPENGGTTGDPNIEFLYRESMEFGRGKNCAAVWRDVDIEDSTDSLDIIYNSWPDYSSNYNDFYRPDIRTDFMPVYISHIPKSRTLKTGFAAGEMAEAGYDLKNLDDLVSEYKKWIDSLKSDTSSEEVQGKENIKNLLKTQDRMMNGIEILRHNADALRSFRFVNRVMATNSMWHSKDSRFEWRPFQLAFLLMEIESLVYPESTDRKQMDILWVHTGSGKTEAYLAVAIFDIIWRRYTQQDRNKNPGTSVITRYTLRLLTSQQFKRTSDIITAAEYVRTHDEGFNDGNRFPISAGMWVGGGMTPNTVNEAINVLKGTADRKSENSGKSGDPVQLYKCPACGGWLAVPESGIQAGTPIFAAGPVDGVESTTAQLLKTEDVSGRIMGIYRISFPNHMTKSDIINSTLYDEFISSGTYLHASGYRVNRNPTGIDIACMNPDCPIFNTRIPAYTVDMEIYREKPSIIVATVDKFAGIPFNVESSNILGDIKGKTPPPDMIIQDELHLLNGPLGSLFGLYENMVNAIIERRGGVRTKYIGASATVSSVDNQVSLLFARNASVFPPSGINLDENFFFTASHVKATRRRIYAGIMGAPDMGVQTPLIRLMSQIIAFRERFNGTELLKNFYTPVFYFNSIKELSIALALFREDVRERLEKLNPPVKLDTANYEELSGKARSGEIPVKLDRLENWNSNSEENAGALFTTSMFGTGVDISRLTEMIMSGQPKSTSDYIQATGRIGRSRDGVVFVLYNPLKPRDASHYEMFMQYHSRINIYVENSPVSPFSTGAILTGLGSTMTGFVRSVEPELTGLKGNGPEKILTYNGTAFQDFIDKTMERLALMHVGNIQRRDVAFRIEENKKIWEDIVNRYGDRSVYSTGIYKRSGTDQGIILGSTRDTATCNSSQIAFKNVPRSLREVEDEAVFGYNELPEYRIRKTQFVLSFGPYSIVEGDTGSYMIPHNRLFGIQTANYRNSTVSDNLINENTGYARNLVASRFKLDRTKIKFIALPSNEYAGLDERTPLYEMNPFPEWGICSNVNGHHRAASILYQYIHVRGDRIKLVACPECGGTRRSPVRFVSACPNGHIDDVQWNYSIHMGNYCDSKYYYWDAGGYSLKSVNIECSKCHAVSDMEKIYKLYNQHRIKCTGNNSNSGIEVCDKYMSIMQRDSSSLRVPDVLTLLNINTEDRVYADGEEELIEAAKLAWNNNPKPSLLESMLITLKTGNPDKYSRIMENPYAYFNGNNSNNILDIIENEYKYLSRPEEKGSDKGFQIGPFSSPETFNHTSILKYRAIQDISAIAVQTSFTRHAGRKTYVPHPVPSYTEFQGNKCFPATVMSGDSIFIQFNEIKTDDKYQNSEVEDNIFGKYPLNYTFTYLHTISHGILRAISRYTGYSLPSIRERIYAFGGEGAILIYTTGIGNDGSMGGIADLVAHDKMGAILNEAMRNISTCSNDPFCMHDSMTADRENGAACYSCVFLPETSCEYGNKYLDRNAVTGV